MTVNPRWDPDAGRNIVPKPSVKPPPFKAPPKPPPPSYAPQDCWNPARRRSGSNPPTVRPATPKPPKRIPPPNTEAKVLDMLFDAPQPDPDRKGKHDDDFFEPDEATRRAILGPLREDPADPPSETESMELAASAHAAWRRMMKRMNPTLLDEFVAFHRANPEVYRLFDRYCREAIRSGRTRLGAKMVVERMRWFTDIETSDGEFKLRNDFTAFYARLWQIRHPEHPAFFRERVQTYAGHERDDVEGTLAALD